MNSNQPPRKPRPPPRKCAACRSTPWTCRGCGRLTCEHFSVLKLDSDRSGLCSVCALARGFTLMGRTV